MKGLKKELELLTWEALKLNQLLDFWETTGQSAVIKVNKEILITSIRDIQNRVYEILLTYYNMD